jgi:DNA-binding LacI/PurR family transcriptional regulator
MELNRIDLEGPSITYEMLARRVCRHGTKPFAFVYGKSQNANPMSYSKEEFRTAVQRAGILQGLLFQDISTAINVGLSQTIRGIEPTPTPLEKVVKA